MHRSTRSALALIVALAAVATVAADAVPVLSRSSAARAERQERWRRQLEVAEAARRAGDPERSAAIYRDLVGEAEAAGDGSLLLARATDGWADVLREEGRPDEAEPLYRRAASLWERLLGPDQPRLAVTLHHLGLVLAALHRSDEARAELGRALVIWEAAGPAGVTGAEATRSALRALDAHPDRDAPGYEPGAGSTGSR